MPSEPRGAAPQGHPAVGGLHRGPAQASVTTGLRDAEPVWTPCPLRVVFCPLVFWEDVGVTAQSSPPWVSVHQAARAP